jgi:hypothetical protein
MCRATLHIICSFPAMICQTHDTFPHSCNVFPCSHLACIFAFYHASSCSHTSSCFIAHLCILSYIFAFHRASLCSHTSLHFIAHLHISSCVSLHSITLHNAFPAFSVHYCRSIHPVPWYVAFHLLLYLTMFGIVPLLFCYGPLLYLTYILRVLLIHF